MKYDSSKHHRRSIRVGDYDYASEGAYFVTICVQNRACLLGEIVGEVMRLHDYGHVAGECWQWLEERYARVILDEWVIMPNHMHGIIVIHNSGGSRTAGTQCVGNADSPCSSRSAHG